MSNKKRKVAIPDLTAAAWMLLGRMAAGVEICGRQYGTRYETTTREDPGRWRSRAVPHSIQTPLHLGELIEREDVLRKNLTGVVLDRGSVWRITRRGRKVWEAYSEGQAEPKGTHAACHGCDSTLKHKKGQVCEECRAELMRGRVAVDEETREPADMVRVLAGVPQVAFFTGASFDQPSLRIRFERLVMEYFGALGETADRDRDADDPVELWENYDTHVVRTKSWVVWMDPLRAHWLAQLVDVIRETNREAYAHGRRDGQSLLLSLADGETTLDDYLDKAARGR